MNAKRACQAVFIPDLSDFLPGVSHQSQREGVESEAIKIKVEPLPRVNSGVDPNTSFRSLAAHLRSLRSCTCSTIDVLPSRVPVDHPK